MRQVVYSIPEEDRDLLYTTFYDTLNDLMSKKNLDVYVTGSNSKMLSSDIATHFRDRGSEIRVFPLSFNEFYSYSGGEKADAFEEYLTYGGMPLAVLEKDEVEKRAYLNGLHKQVYLKDIVEQHSLPCGPLSMISWGITFWTCDSTNRLPLAQGLGFDLKTLYLF